MPSDLREFQLLIRRGKLFAVQDWLRHKGYVAPVKGFRSSLLIAVDTGFHSMVEVLVNSGPTQQEKDAALVAALERPSSGIAELLVANGAAVKSVPYSRVCDTRNPELARFFEAHGADLITGEPLYQALKEENRALLNICKERLPSQPAIQVQLDRALSEHVRTGNSKWMKLLLWAGADPRGESEDHLSPLDTAIYFGEAQALAMMRQYLRDDDLSRLLPGLCTEGRVDLVKEFLRRGADSNRHDSAWNTFPLAFEYLHVGHFCPPDRPARVLACIEHLVAAGIRWDPKTDEVYRVRAARTNLRKIPKNQCLDLIQQIYEAQTLGSSFEFFFCHPAFRTHFQSDPRQPQGPHPALKLIFPSRDCRSRMT